MRSTAAGLPEHAFTLIEGEEAGVDALRDPKLAVASFTGSVRGGRALAAIAAARARPIPFYGELGSVNPVFVTAAAVAERGRTIAEGFVASVSGSAGQLCTKPGFLLLPADHWLDGAIAAAANGVGGHRLLSAPITAGYVSRRDEILGTPGVRVLAEGAVGMLPDGVGTARPTVVAVDLATLESQRERLLDEAFGPLSVVVDVPEGTALDRVAADLFPGVLTAGIHLGRGEESDEAPCARDQADVARGPGAVRRLADRRRRLPRHAARRSVAVDHDRRDERRDRGDRPVPARGRAAGRPVLAAAGRAPERRGRAAGAVRRRRILRLGCTLPLSGPRAHRRFTVRR